MKKLKNKVFIVLVIILTCFLCSILFIFNYQDYSREKMNIDNNLKRMFDDRDNSDKVPPKKELDKMIFMDSVVYIVKIDSSNNILDITNNSNNDVSDSEIEIIAKNILDSSSDFKVGNLFFDQYSYSKKQDSIIIIDNTFSRNKLLSSLKNSFIIFFVLEILIVYVSWLLTKWITKPVLSSFEKQRQFIADASHELKTPLSIIIASSDSLEKNPNEIKWLEYIKGEAVKMNGLVTDLLELARSEDVSLKEELVNTNISKQIELSILSFEGIIYERGLKLNYYVQDDLYLKCDVNKIKQLVGILIDNAIKHSYENETVEVDLRSDRNNIILKVKNRGDVIEKEDIDKIFERFYRADKSRNRNDKRYGLGLSIAKNIVTLHGGKIEVSSSSKETIFKVIFKKST